MRHAFHASLLAPPLCWGCGAVAPGAEHLCGACRGALRPLGPAQPALGGLVVWAAVAYEGPARELVWALKYRGARGVSATMAAQMAATGPSLAGALVPVPLHSARLRRRGFNQARALAEELACRLRLPLVDCLERSGPAVSQVGRQRSERLVGPALRMRTGSRCPARALLVDDVVTTGATLAACAAVLRLAGARKVSAIAYARTLAR